MFKSELVGYINHELKKREDDSLSVRMIYLIQNRWTTHLEEYTVLDMMN